jgi:hypothetical protein
LEVRDCQIAHQKFEMKFVIAGEMKFASKFRNKYQSSARVQNTSTDDFDGDVSVWIFNRGFSTTTTDNKVECL